MNFHHQAISPGSHRSPCHGDHLSTDAGAVARIALVGEALVFVSVWDGQEFLISFSRTL